MNEKHGTFVAFYISHSKANNNVDSKILNLINKNKNYGTFVAVYLPIPTTEKKEKYRNLKNIMHITQKKDSKL